VHCFPIHQDPGFVRLLRGMLLFDCSFRVLCIYISHICICGFAARLSRPIS
jgi:hypothetical protein